MMAIAFAIIVGLAVAYFKLPVSGSVEALEQGKGQLRLEESAQGEALSKLRFSPKNNRTGFTSSFFLTGLTRFSG